MTVGHVDVDESRRADDLPAIEAVQCLALVADCRLENRAVLSRTLGLAEDCRQAQLLLAAYATWGADLSRHLIGNFAVVFWDFRRRQALLIRDHLGIKPLYYSVRGAVLTVATDLPLLVSIARPAAIPDDEVVVEHLLMNYRSRDRTFWAQIKRVPGGHAVILDRDRERVFRYWQMPHGDVTERSTADVHERAHAFFEAAVRQQLQSDGSILAHLSGGLDSSSVVCAARAVYSEEGPRPPLALGGAAYPGLECDESPYIEAVARETAFPLHRWDARFEGIAPLTSPSASGPGTGENRAGDLMLAHRLGARVLLSGQGGDFLCSCDGVAEDIIAARPRTQVAKRILGPGVSLDMRVARARSLLRRSLPIPIRRGVGYMRGRWRAPVWLERRWGDLAGSLVASRYPEELRGEMSSHVKAAHWRSIQSASLALGLESEHERALNQGMEMRYPFLDVSLVEYILSIPFVHWPAPAPYARLHREFMGRDLPDVVRSRPKTTFSEAVAFRLRHARPQIRELLFSGEWHAARYVSRPAAQKLAQETESAAADDWTLWRAVWGIATLEAWLRTISGYPTRTNGSRHG